MEASQAFALLAEYAVAQGAKSIGALPGCWERRIDDHWWVAVNGHKAVEMPCSREAPVPPLHAYIEYDNWPAGVISIDGGVIVAGDANEDAFIAALKRALGSLEGRRP